MNFKREDKKPLFILLFCVLSFLAGAVNGFLGTGGGIIFVLMLSIITKNDSKDNFATTLVATLVISLFGIISYEEKEQIDFGLLFKIVPFGLIGGAFGAFLTDKFKPRILNVIFAFLIIYSGLCMILR